MEMMVGSVWMTFHQVGPAHCNICFGWVRDIMGKGLYKEMCDNYIIIIIID